VKSLNNKFFLSILLSILLIGQTTNSTNNLIQWFSSFLPIVVNLFVIFSIIMFIYAILKAPLDILKKDLRYVRYITYAVFLGQTLDYLSSVAQTLMSLLYLFFIFLLPLILILILYRSFMALVRSK